MAVNLAEKLRKGTTKSHSMAENVSFVKSFLGGVVDKKSYRKIVANLYFIKIVMEEQIFLNKDHSAIKPIYFPELNRKLSLEKDLAYYYGINWKEQIVPSDATQIYIRRIHDIGTRQPELLVTHAYTRYMGELSGGQTPKKIAQNAMNLSTSDGTAFYDFENLQDEGNSKKSIVIN